MPLPAALAALAPLLAPAAATVAGVGLAAAATFGVVEAKQDAPTGEKLPTLGVTYDASP